MIATEAPPPRPSPVVRTVSPANEREYQDFARAKWRRLTDEDYAEIARYARPPSGSGIELSPEQAWNLEQFVRASGLADEYRNYDIVSGNFIDESSPYHARALESAEFAMVRMKEHVRTRVLTPEQVAQLDAYLRLVWKMSERRWKYGDYAPQPEGATPSPR